MKIRLPLMVQDPAIARYSLKEGQRVTENFYIDPQKGEFARDGPFLDGPVAKRVAVLDFDPDSGDLSSGVRFRPASECRRYREYAIADEEDVHAADFIAVNAFGTVLRTMYMFEEDDTLARPVTWAFDAPQLLVVPRAGEWANAFYERDSHSLQLFYFPNPEKPKEKIYTSLSRDIVAHETGHAILDGIVPRLYDAITPQSLGLHEAIADLTAVLMAFPSRDLARGILRHTRGSIQDSTAFSSVAEQFGMARYKGGSLRNLFNEKTLDDADHSEPYSLSEVLSGALYKVMTQIHEELKARYAHKPNYADKPDPLFSASGEALAVGSKWFKRLIFRALDYLPPAEVSFSDYGRAIIAADQAAYPDDTQEREWIREEFLRRKMVPNRQALEVRTNYEHQALQDIDLETLIHSDWAAYEFANRHREFLRIPLNPEVTFHIKPRLVVKRFYYHRDRGKVPVEECLFKVWWDAAEANEVGSGLPRRRQISVGTTLVFGKDEDTGTMLVRALLTTDRRDRPQEQDDQQKDRDVMLHRLVDQDLLRFGNLALGPDGKPLRSVIEARTMGDLMRLHGTARMLHIVGEV